jgi:hypothetical protein
MTNNIILATIIEDVYATSKLTHLLQHLDNITAICIITMKDEAINIDNLLDLITLPVDVALYSDELELEHNMDIHIQQRTQVLKYIVLNNLDPKYTHTVYLHASNIVNIPKYTFLSGFNVMSYKSHDRWQPFIYNANYEFNIQLDKKKRLTHKLSNNDIAPTYKYLNNVSANLGYKNPNISCGCDGKCCIDLDMPPEYFLDYFSG